MKHFLIIFLLISLSTKAQIRNSQQQEQSDLQLHFFMMSKFQKSLIHYDSLVKITKEVPQENHQAALMALEELELNNPGYSLEALRQKKESIRKYLPQKSTFEDNDIKTVDVADSVGVMPEFPGGMTAFYKYVSTNMKYPKEARKLGIQGRVYVQFLVTDDGSVTNVKSVKGLGAGCDQEAIRVISESPTWTPGYKDNKAVTVRIVLPIIFKLSN